jgi:hypothetical protein
MMTIFCTAHNDNIAYNIIEELQSTGYPIIDISIVVHDPNFKSILTDGVKTEIDVKAPYQCALGDVLCGSLGWIDDIDSVPIAGIGHLIVTGPLLSSLSLAALDIGTGGIAGMLMHQDVPESQAKNLESQIRDKCFMIAVHALNERDAHHIVSIFVKEGAEYVVSVHNTEQHISTRAQESTAQHSH